MSRREGRHRLLFVLALLVALQFAVRPWLGDPRWAPDFLLVALVVYAIRSRPGQGAVAGFIIGILGDAAAPTAFGAGAFAHTLVGYLSAWGKAVFFADNVLVNAGFFFIGTWLRNVVVLLASGTDLPGAGLWQVLVWSPLMGLATAVAGVIVLVVFRSWLSLHTGER